MIILGEFLINKITPLMLVGYEMVMRMAKLPSHIHSAFGEYYFNC